MEQNKIFEFYSQFPQLFFLMDTMPFHQTNLKSHKTHMMTVGALHDS